MYMLPTPHPTAPQRAESSQAGLPGKGCCPTARLHRPSARALPVNTSTWNWARKKRSSSRPCSQGNPELLRHPGHSFHTPFILRQPPPRSFQQARQNACRQQQARLVTLGRAFQRRGNLMETLLVARFSPGAGWQTYSRRLQEVGKVPTTVLWRGHPRSTFLVCAQLPCLVSFGSQVTFCSSSRSKQDGPSPPAPPMKTLSARLPPPAPSPPCLLESPEQPECCSEDLLLLPNCPSSPNLGLPSRRGSAEQSTYFGGGGAFGGGGVLHRPLNSTRQDHESGGQTHAWPAKEDPGSLPSYSS